MPAIFLFGTLRHAALLEAVAGADLPAKAAVLADHRVATGPEGIWPVLTMAVGADAPGIVVDVDPSVLERLDFYEACFGYTRAPVEVTCDGAPLVADAWFPDTSTTSDTTNAVELGADWTLADWAARWGPVTTLAAEEVMRLMGHATPDQVAARFWIIRARADAHLRARGWTRAKHVTGGLTREDVTPHKMTYAYKGFFNVVEVKLSHKRFDGGTIGPMTRGIFEVADAVTVLPYDPVRDCILVVEQIRLGPFVHGDPNPWILEPVAGLIDAGETPESCARREAQEEAHLSLGAMEQIGRYYPTPGGVSQVLISYIGLADLPPEATTIGGHAAENEDILSHIIPFDLACRMMQEGDMPNGPLIMSMQYLMLHRDRLRAGSG